MCILDATDDALFAKSASFAALAFVSKHSRVAIDGFSHDPAVVTRAMNQLREIRRLAETIDLGALTEKDRESEHLPLAYRLTEEPAIAKWLQLFAHTVAWGFRCPGLNTQPEA